MSLTTKQKQYIVLGLALIAEYFVFDGFINMSAEDMIVAWGISKVIAIPLLHLVGLGFTVKYIIVFLTAIGGGSIIHRERILEKLLRK